MDREDIMGTPSPELKQLWIRVLKRVHPDLAIDEQDRIRCERLTQLANEAFQAGDVEALMAVLRPSQPPNAGAPRAYTGPRQRRQPPPPPPTELREHQGSRAPNIPPKRSFKSWFWLSNVPPGTAFSFKQLLPAAIATVALIWIGLSVYLVAASRHGVTDSPTAQVESISVPIQAHVEVPDAGIWQPLSSKSNGDATHNRISQNLNPHTVVETSVGPSREGFPTQVSLLTTNDPPQASLKASTPLTNSAEPSPLYMKQMRERLYQSFSTYESVDADVPAGNSAEMWFDVNRDGSLSNVRVGKPSGWNSLDYACVRAVQRTETVGALPEDYKLRTLPATFACTYTGSNATRTSRSVDSATDRPDLYVGSIRNTTHE
jgi:TonB family protein